MSDSNEYVVFEGFLPSQTAEAEQNIFADVSDFEITIDNGVISVTLIKIKK